MGEGVGEAIASACGCGCEAAAYVGVAGNVAAGSASAELEWYSNQGHRSSSYALS